MGRRPGAHPRLVLVNTCSLASHYFRYTHLLAPVGRCSATFLAVLGNFLYILAMQLIGDRVSSRVFNWVTIATMGAGAALMVAIRGKGQRSAVDEGKTTVDLLARPRVLQ